MNTKLGAGDKNDKAGRVIHTNEASVEKLQCFGAAARVDNGPAGRSAALHLITVI